MGADSLTSSTLASRFAAVHARIQHATQVAARPADAVTMLAVSKTQPAAAIRAVWALGQRVFGENYVQEALEKMAELADLALEWHFIGRVQTNKTRLLAEHFAWVHGVSEARHLERLAQHRPPGLPPLNICIQVNVSGERSKGGVTPEAVGNLIAAACAWPQLHLRGLMTIPAPAATPEAARIPFAQLRHIREQWATPACPLATLSMGMSEDLEAAVAEGATLVRIGTAIFGSRT